jgi:RHS repeat-associated protein
VRGIDGQLDAVTGVSGSAVLQLSNIHGDVTVQLPLNGAQSAVNQSYDEYGNAESDTAGARYGWLGTAQRSADSATEAVLMGQRLYDPTVGRFLSVDPVLGGNDDAYVYPADLWPSSPTVSASKGALCGGMCGAL